MSRPKNSRPVPRQCERVCKETLFMTRTKKGNYLVHMRKPAKVSL